MFNLKTSRTSLLIAVVLTLAAEIAPEDNAFSQALNSIWHVNERLIE